MSVKNDDLLGFPRRLGMGPGTPADQAVLAGGRLVPFRMVITGTTTAPTRGSSINVEQAVARRVGDCLEVFYTYWQTSAGTTGSGSYLFGLPFNLRIDSNKLYVLGSTGTALGVCGTAEAFDGATAFVGIVKARDVSNVYVTALNAGTANDVGSGLAGLGNTQVRISFRYVVPIEGWSESGSE